MRVILLAVLAAGIAVPALGQTTVCGWELGKWVCRAQPQANIADSLQGGAALQRQLQDQGRAARAGVDQSFREARRRQASRAIAAGDCGEARRIAGASGDIDLAEMVSRSCEGR